MQACRGHPSGYERHLSWHERHLSWHERRLQADFWHSSADFWHLQADFWHLQADFWHLQADFWHLQADERRLSVVYLPEFQRFGRKVRFGMAKPPLFRPYPARHPDATLLDLRSDRVGSETDPSPLMRNSPHFLFAPTGFSLHFGAG